MLAKTLPSGTTQMVVDEHAAPGRKQSFFMYHTSFTPIAVSALVTNAIQIDADSDFVALAGVMAVFDSPADAAVVANPRFTVQVTSTGSGRIYMNEGVDIGNMFGSAQRPSWFERPMVFPANSVVNVQIRNLQAVAFNVRLGFMGAKVYLPNRG